MIFSAIFLLGMIMAGTYGACPSEYSSIAPDHTMCLTDIGTDIPMTQSEKDDVVNRHNKYREEVKGGATNMQKLIWDDDLATVAAKWSRQCKVDHEKPETKRMLPGMPGMTIGQNAAGGQSSVLAAVEYWATEIADFTYGVRTGKDVGHYTQLVFADTVRVGCGQAQCKKWKVQICNYAPGQTGEDVDMIPYKRGSACSDCSGHCDSSQKLCDCGGKVCYNNGKINLSTCTCDCPRGYGGDLCQTKNCPGSDTPECPGWIAHFGSADAICRYDNVLKEICMYTCKFCP